MEQNKDQIGAAVRGEAVAICPECGDVALCPRCDAAPVVVLTDAQIGNFWMNRDCMDAIRAGDVVAQFVSAFRAGMKALGVSARAADAPSEPTFVWIAGSKTFSQVFGSEEAAREFVSHLPPSVSGGISITKSVVIGKSRAADALDSQPTDPYPLLRAAFTTAESGADGYFVKFRFPTLAAMQAAHMEWHGVSSQPTDGGVRNGN